MAELARHRAVSRDATSVLAHYREHERPKAEVVRRSWQALRERVLHPEVATREAWVLQLPETDEPYGADDLFADEPYAPLPAPASRLFHYVKAVATSVAIAAAVLLGMRVVIASATTMTQAARDTALQAPYQGGAGAEQGRAAVVQPQPVARASGSAKSVAAAPAPAVEAEVEVEVEVEAAVQVAGEPVPVAMPAPAERSRKGKAGRAKPVAATQVDDIAAELGLVKEATQAKNRGDMGRALALLSEHADRFAAGALAQERQVLRAEILCARGQRSDAKALAGRFAAQYPTSALLGRMNGVCAD